MAVSSPGWLHLIAIASLVVAGGCTIVIAADQVRRPQRMAVMTLVWPLTALFGGVLWLALYWRWGRAATKAEQHRREERGDKPPGMPLAVSIATGASHCGAGCTLGDIIGEWLAFFVPAVAAAFGWRWLFADRIIAVWVLDFLLAFSIGIGFQYFAIAPMRHLSVGRGLVAALKADTVSIASWQLGMYGIMALAQFAWLRPAYGAVAPVDSPEFWFVMQVAMLGGFATAYPVNWWLVSVGIKERM